jgi:ATP-dependent Lon protease
MTLLPLLPLRDVVVFPHMVIPLFVGRPKSIKALDVAMDSGKHILLVAQKSAAKEDPGADDLYPIGCVATVLQMLKLPDGTVKVLVEGAHRSSVVRVMDEGEYLSAQAATLPGDLGEAHEVRRCRALLAQFDQYVKLSRRSARDRGVDGRIDDGNRLADAIAASAVGSAKAGDSRDGRSSEAPRASLGLLEGEVILQVEKRCGRVGARWRRASASTTTSRSKGDQEELGGGRQNADLDEMEEDQGSQMSRGRSQALAEIKKLKLMSPMSAEATSCATSSTRCSRCPGRRRAR